MADSALLLAFIVNLLFAENIQTYIADFILRAKKCAAFKDEPQTQGFYLHTIRIVLVKDSIL